MSSINSLAAISPVAEEAIEPTVLDETVSPEKAKTTTATNKQKAAITKLCKIYGWNVTKTKFETSGDWFLVGNDYENYKAFSKKVELNGGHFSRALVGTKKYSNSGKPYYVTFVVALSDDNQNEIVGAFILPVAKKKSMSLKNMTSLATSPNQVKKSINIK